MRVLCAFPTLVVAFGGALTVSGCADEAGLPVADQTRDPIIARALHDPIMVDPDLAYRTESAAALTTGAGQPLPVLAGSPELARLAREEARLELLESGTIVDLPAAVEADGRPQISPSATAAEAVLAFDGPTKCTKQLQAGFHWADRLESEIRTMPRGYVRAAAGVENGECSARVIRYLTPAMAEDALEYHFNQFKTAGLDATFTDKPQSTILATADDATHAVIVREAANAMRQIDMVYWKAK